PDQQGPVTAAHSRTRRRTPQGDAELMAKEQVLGFKPARDLKKAMTNIARECRSANIVRDHAMILPDDATPKPDGIFGKDSRVMRAWASPSWSARSVLYECDCAQAAVGTNADDRAAALWQYGKFFDRLTQYARSSGAERMTKRNAAAVRVHSIARKTPEGMFDAGLFANEILIFESPDMTGHLGRKRLVNLPKRNVLELEPTSREQPRNRANGRHKQPFVEDVDRGHLKIDKAHAWCRTGQSRQAFSGSDPDGGCSVG